MIKDGYGGVKMCRVQAGQTMSTAAPRRHGDAQLVPGAALSHFDKDGKGGDTCLICSFDQFFGFCEAQARVRQGLSRDGH